MNQMSKMYNYAILAAYNGVAGASVVEILGIGRVEKAIATLFSSYGLAYLVTPLIAGILTFVLLSIFTFG